MAEGQGGVTERKGCSWGGAACLGGPGRGAAGARGGHRRCVLPPASRALDPEHCWAGLSLLPSPRARLRCREGGVPRPSSDLPTPRAQLCRPRLPTARACPSLRRAIIESKFSPRHKALISKVLLQYSVPNSSYSHEAERRVEPGTPEDHGNTLHPPGLLHLPLRRSAPTCRARRSLCPPWHLPPAAWTGTKPGNEPLVQGEQPSRVPGAGVRAGPPIAASSPT